MLLKAWDMKDPSLVIFGGQRMLACTLANVAPRNYS